MVNKESLRLGQSVEFGEERTSAVVDALTQSGAGLAYAGGYAVVRYEDVYARDEKESC